MRDDKILKSAQEKERRCSKCHKVKNIEEFSSQNKLDQQGNEVDVHQYQCKECANQYGKKWQDNRKKMHHKNVNAWTFVK